MPDYLPNIPAGTDNLSTSQGQIQNNFSQLNTIFANDHYTWNDATLANRGLHKHVTFPAVVADPVLTSATQAELYTKTVSGTAQLFFANYNGSTVVQQMTPTSGLVSQSGSLTFPNGVIMKWGIFTMAGGVTNTPDINFPGGAFPNNVFVAPIIGSTSSDPAQVAGVKLSAVTLTKFQAFRTGTNNLSYYYIAIGN